MKQVLSIFLLFLSISLYSQTPITTPSYQAYNVTMTNISTSSIKIDWSSGAGVYEIVVIRPAANTRVAPTNAGMSGYSSNAVYGSGTNLGSSNYVVYKGSGNSVTVTGLVAGVNYEAVVYSYNYGCLQYMLGTCVQTGYLLNTSYSTSNSEQHYTLATKPTAVPTATLVGTPSANTATISFTGAGANWSLISVRNQTVSGASPVDGTYYGPSSSFGSGSQIGGTGTYNYCTYFNSATGTVNLSNLQPATSYWARLYACNGTGASTNNSYNYYGYYSVSFSTYNTPPTINSISNYTLCQNAPTTTVSLSGIGDGSSAETQTVTLSASSSNTALIPNPTISYTHPIPQVL